MKSWVGLLTLLLIPTFLATAQERHALVIGNSAYQHSRKLDNPVNDALKMSEQLNAAGFRVTLLRDASHERMETALKDFADDLTPASTALVFYAGHGIQVRGVSYLLPVDAVADAPETLKYEAVALDMALDLLDKNGQGAGLKIVILDCCRDDPFGQKWRGNRETGSKGMAAPTSTPKGTVLCFATAPGDVAKDGFGSNSPYTSGLLQHLFAAGLELDIALRRAGAAVQQVTKGEQTPWRNSNFNGEFRLVPSTAQTQPSDHHPANPSQREPFKLVTERLKSKYQNNGISLIEIDSNATLPLNKEGAIKFPVVRGQDYSVLITAGPQCNRIYGMLVTEMKTTFHYESTQEQTLVMSFRAPYNGSIELLHRLQSLDKQNLQTEYGVYLAREELNAPLVSQPSLPGLTNTLEMLSASRERSTAVEAAYAIGTVAMKGGQYVQPLDEFFLSDGETKQFSIPVTKDLNFSLVGATGPMGEISRIQISDTKGTLLLDEQNQGRVFGVDIPSRETGVVNASITVRSQENWIVPVCLLVGRGNEQLLSREIPTTRFDESPTRIVERLDYSYQSPGQLVSQISSFYQERGFYVMPIESGELKSASSRIVSIPVTFGLDYVIYVAVGDAIRSVNLQVDSDLQSRIGSDERNFRSAVVPFRALVNGEVKATISVVGFSGEKDSSFTIYVGRRGTFSQ